MSVRSTVSLTFLALFAAGLGYVTFVDDQIIEGFWPTEAGLDGTVDQTTQAQTAGGTSDVDRPNNVQNLTAQNSAARRMDDFGAGPGGSVVTAPLKERYRQAFSGQTTTGGGAPSESAGKSTTGTPADDNDQASARPPTTVPGKTPAMETAAVDMENADPDEQAAKPRYHVVERAPEATGYAETPVATLSRITPSFDVVRIDPAGNAVIAGRAAPLADVEIKIGDQVVDRIKASPRGEWVSIPAEPLASGDQELSLSASAEDDAPVLSSQIVIVSIPERAERQSGDGSQSVAVILDKVKGGEGRILQAPDALTSDSDLALRMVDYDDLGAIRLSGDAPAGVPVRIYVDNEPAALVIGDSKGQWVTTLDQNLPGGDYTLRLDQLDTRGQTISRIETPLTRVTAPPIEGEAKVDYVVVQPGNSLWRIARRLSGDGFNYVYIYEANQTQIRDPDVIYPGQVFEVPAGSGIAG